MSTRKALALPFKVGMWAGGVYLAVASLVAWVSMFGIVGFLLGGTLVPDLALPFLIRARTGEWPVVALLILAGALACSAVTVLLDPDAGEHARRY